MILIDTNIFLELFLGQEKARECEEFLNKIAEGEIGAVVTTFTIHACEALLNDSRNILIFLRNIQNSLGILIYNTSIDDEIATAMLMNKIGLDFDDALQYYVATKLGAEAILSYDKHFDKTDIKRKEPREYLK
jgi:predicted nucleic acid-binding protein